MVTRIHTKLLSDLDGEEATHTTRFGLDGKEYSIDLTDEQDDELREFMAKYVTSAQKITTGRPGPSAYRQQAIPAYQSQQARRDELTEMRAWARSKNIDVAERGRVPQSIIDMYNNRHSLESAAIAEAAEKANEKHKQDTLDVVNGKVPVRAANGSKVKVPAGKTVPPVPKFSEKEEPAKPAPTPAARKAAAPKKPVRATVARNRRAAAQ